MSRTPAGVEGIPIRIAVDASPGHVCGLLRRSPAARWLLVLAHGAGAGMRHAFMEALATALDLEGIATLRYQFPYVERGERRPDPPRTLVATVRAAIGAAADVAGDLPLLVGGKSLGGRMTTTALATEAAATVRGIVLVGFPLHPPGRSATTRAAHLRAVPVPMLFLQGTRDRLADLDLMRSVCEALTERATLHVVADADHAFQVRKRSGRTPAEAIRELASTVSQWAETLSPS